MRDSVDPGGKSLSGIKAFDIDIGFNEDFLDDIVGIVFEEEFPGIALDLLFLALDKNIE